LHIDVARVAVGSFIRKKHVPLRRWPTIEWDDALAVGNEALCHAARTWAPSAGPFAPYAFHRIYFSMIDWLRKEGPITRGGIPRADFKTQSFIDYDHEHDDNLLPTKAIFRQHLQEDFSEVLLGRMFLKDMLKHLSERERFVLTECLAHGTTERDVGKELGVTESRVSQIKHAALTKLRRSDDVLATILS
jgi:RNA polymerase sigma factor (sigma-70 family)